jgi:outer membrane receptor for ferrienterochelin and colicins
LPYGSTVVAQQDSSSKTVNINDVVVTGQYGESSLTKSVYKVTVIDQKRIQLQGAFNLKTVLTNELNIRISNDPALGGSLSIQGISGQNIKIMVDGVPLIGREGGNIDLNQINLNNIERIELVEGPMSVNFGTDALGGVINLITKKSKPKTASIGANTYYETIGQYNAGFNVGGFAKTWSIDGGFARNFFEGYNEDPSSRKKQWKPRLQYFGDLAINKILSSGNIRYTLNVFNEKVIDRDSPTITPYYAYANDVYLYSQRITNALFWNTKWKQKYPINIVGSYSHYRRIKNTYRKDLVSLDQQLIPSDQEQDTNFFNAWMSRGTITQNLKPKSISYQLGYEVNYENATGKRIRNNAQSIADMNAFGSAEFKLKKLLFRPGLRLIHNSKYPAPIVPSLNIKWDLTSYMTLRGSYGRGFRAPSLKELYLDFVDPSHNVQGNENLKAETQNNYQLGAIFQWTEFERIFSIDPSIYYNHIQNKIDLALVQGSTLAASYINITDFKSLGLAANMAYKAPHYGLTLGYSYMGINNSLMAQSDDHFYFSSQYRANLNYTFTKSGITIASFYKYNSKIVNPVFDSNTGNVISGFVNAYNLWDASISKSFLHKRMALTTGAKNLTNVKNVAASISGGVHNTTDNTANIAMGRTFFISCTYQLITTAK